MKYYIGQGFGFLAMFLTFLSYQAKSHKKLLCVQTASTLSVMVSYFLLGKLTGALTNFVCVIRNFVFFTYDKKGKSSVLWTAVLTVMIGAAGALSWQNAASLLVIAALMINTVMLSLKNNQALRVSILFTSGMVLAYNLISRVWGGVCSEALAILSSAIALIRYRANAAKSGEVSAGVLQNLPQPAAEELSGNTGNADNEKSDQKGNL